jgi:hypothetical protein
MYSRFTIQTRLSNVEAEAILEGLVRPPQSTFAPDPPSLDARPFAGAVDNGAFKFHRVITGRNSFLPIVVGRVVQAEGGAIVSGHMRMAVSVMLFMALWMGMAMTAAVNEIPADLQRGDMMGALAIGFFPVFGAVLIGVGYYPERRKALQLLSDAFQPNCRA